VGWFHSTHHLQSSRQLTAAIDPGHGTAVTERGPRERRLVHDDDVADVTVLQLVLALAAETAEEE
jgi:hypothetical protein